MLKRSITLKGHRTSISLEKEFWDELVIIAAQENRTLPALINQIDRNRLKLDPAPGLASAIRVYILKSRTQAD